jgi:predicted nucleic acid-binding protein
MIAVDTCSLIAFFQGEKGPDVESFEQALAAQALALPPVVLTEVLSRPPASAIVKDLLDGVPCLTISQGYWDRTAHLRRIILAKGLKSRLGDALIAQSCIDHDVALITRDADFRHYAAEGGLKLG